jgi:uncharacterized coiled-coil DUF342 family protein
MSNVNQLLDKALSTSSEEEAFTCLRRARKRNAGETVAIYGEVNWKQEADEANKRARLFMDEMNMVKINRNEITAECNNLKSEKAVWKILFYTSVAIWLITWWF